MKTLALPSYSTIFHSKNARKKSTSPDASSMPIIKANDKAATKSATSFFNPDARENLTTKECVIRGLFVMTMPMLSAIDWNYGTHTLIFIVPAIFYLEVTAFTMNCPIKALFSNYSHPTKYE